MPIDVLVLMLWVATLFLVAWQLVLTVQLQRIGRARTSSEGDVNHVGVGLMYQGLLEELRSTADEKVALLEERIDELEQLLGERERAEPARRGAPVSLARERARRDG